MSPPGPPASERRTSAMRACRMAWASDQGSGVRFGVRVGVELRVRVRVRLRLRRRLRRRLG
eukprot:scaffold3319_cov56-Phaeocystis_antarctica.AAC.5